MLSGGVNRPAHALESLVDGDGRDDRRVVGGRVENPVDQFRWSGGTGGVVNSHVGVIGADERERRLDGLVAMGLTPPTEGDAEE
ncbi:MAG: hypothetical protein EDM82_12015 [Cyanobacteria bacterium CYA]|nr:MAG: hypothetical protein EDM82_12015 [Cyanobacteria bacterium CYA]